MIAENDPENMWINLAGFEVLVLAETGSTNDDAKIFSEQVDGEFAVWEALSLAIQLATAPGVAMDLAMAEPRFRCMRRLRFPF